MEKDFKKGDYIYYHRKLNDYNFDTISARVVKAHKKRLTITEGDSWGRLISFFGCKEKFHITKRICMILHFNLGYQVKLSAAAKFTITLLT